MPTRTEDVLAVYAAHLRTERHASPHTIRGYLSDLRQFFAFAGAPGAVRADTIRHWLRTLDGTTERTSIARKLAAVRGLFRFLADRRRLAADPTLGIATPKTRRKLPAHLTLDDIDRLLATPRGDTLAGLRGRAFLEVLYSSGLRVSELVGLDWEHVDQDAGLLRVLGKGRKERVVPVGRPALRALAAYRVRSAEAGLAVAHGPVFLNARGGQVTIGQTIMKSNARKLRRLYQDRVLAGFAGAGADALTLFERFEAKLQQVSGNLRRAAVDLAKDWRTDRLLRRLEALLVIADRESSLVVSGTGDVIEPEDGLCAIGSGGNFALAAARVLVKHSQLDARQIAEEALRAAAEICVYTNDELVIEELDAG